jgi:hypothetical protein
MANKKTEPAQPPKQGSPMDIFNKALKKIVSVPKKAIQKK